MNIKIHQLDQIELHEALSLVWKVFCEFEAVNDSDSKKQVFWKAIHSEDYMNMLNGYGAFDEEKLIGIIALRNKNSHIALFFVDGAYQHQGIGRSLWDTILKDNHANEITVHSSLYAQDIYKKLGFIQTNDVLDEDGIQYVPMVYKNLIFRLQDKDDKKAYQLSKEISAKSAVSDEYYTYFDDFISLINAKSSFVRTRGFTLCCAQARWDNQGKLKKALPDMFILLHDDKPTVVRQCLKALHEVALYLPELDDIIKQELERIDLSKYKDSMVALIQKDIEELMKSVD